MLDLAIIGSQKSGTSTLREALARHPQVFVPLSEDEIFEVDEWDLGHALDHFSSQRREAGSRLLGLKRPELLAIPGMPTRFRSVAPDARLIVLLRNPVDRAFSAYAHYARLGNAPDLEISVGLRALLEGNFRSNYPRSAEILEYGFVGRQLASWFDTFDGGQILVLRFEDLEGEPRRLASEIQDHLSLATPPPLHSVGRVNPGVYSSGVRRLRVATRPLAHSAPQLVRALEVFDARIMRRARNRSLSESRDPAVVDQLRSFYERDQQLLNQLLN